MRSAVNFCAAQLDRFTARRGGAGDKSLPDTDEDPDEAIRNGAFGMGIPYDLEFAAGAQDLTTSVRFRFELEVERGVSMTVLGCWMRTRKSRHCTEADPGRLGYARPYVFLQHVFPFDFLGKSGYPQMLGITLLIHCVQRSKSLADNLFWLICLFFNQLFQGVMDQ